MLLDLFSLPPFFWYTCSCITQNHCPNLNIKIFLIIIIKEENTSMSTNWLSYNNGTAQLIMYMHGQRVKIIDSNKL